MAIVRPAGVPPARVLGTLDHAPSVTWTEAPSLRFVEGGVLTGLPQIVDEARSRRGLGLRLRVGRDHLELFTVRRSRGRSRWESTDVPVSRPVPDGCAPS